jgi:hypothetical protein
MRAVLARGGADTAAAGKCELVRRITEPIPAAEGAWRYRVRTIVSVNTSLSPWVECVARAKMRMWRRFRRADTACVLLLHLRFQTQLSACSLSRACIVVPCSTNSWRITRSTLWKRRCSNA